MRFLSSFDGDKKIGSSLLQPFEEKLKAFLVPFVPSSIETYHLTLLTIPWSLLIILFSFLAEDNISWLWGVPLMILFQYLTDLLDGAIGRARQTGLIKWGYYMDHFLDYFFLCSILIGYFFILPTEFVYLHFFLLAIFGGYMVNSFLAFAVTNKFQISYLGIGPTEIRIIFIIVDVLLLLFGRTHMGAALPYILIISSVGLVITVYRTQRVIWKFDMQEKRRPSHKD